MKCFLCWIVVLFCDFHGVNSRVRSLDSTVEDKVCQNNIQIFTCQGDDPVWLINGNTINNGDPRYQISNNNGMSRLFVTNFTHDGFFSVTCFDENKESKNFTVVQNDRVSGVDDINPVFLFSQDNHTLVNLSWSHSEMDTIKQFLISIEEPVQVLTLNMFYIFSLPNCGNYMIEITAINYCKKGVKVLHNIITSCSNEEGGSINDTKSTAVTMSMYNSGKLDHIFILIIIVILLLVIFAIVYFLLKCRCLQVQSDEHCAEECHTRCNNAQYHNSIEVMQSEDCTNTTSYTGIAQNENSTSEDQNSKDSIQRQNSIEESHTFSDNAPHHNSIEVTQSEDCANKTLSTGITQNENSTSEDQTSKYSIQRQNSIEGDNSQPPVSNIRNDSEQPFSFIDIPELGNIKKNHFLSEHLKQHKKIIEAITRSLQGYRKQYKKKKVKETSWFLREYRKQHKKKKVKETPWSLREYRKQHKKKKVKETPWSLRECWKQYKKKKEYWKQYKKKKVKETSWSLRGY